MIGEAGEGYMRKIIDTQRLVLRELETNDIDGLFELFSDPKVMRYLQGTKTRSETEAWLNLVFESYRNMHFGPWAVILKKSKRFLGYCGLYLQKNINHRDEVELLYGLSRRHWGMGYATEAAKGVSEHGKTELGIERFVSLVSPDNLRSSKVAQKLGMTLETKVRRWKKQYHLYSLQEI